MQWWLLMGDFDGTLRYLHSYDEIMKGKGVQCVATRMRCRSPRASAVHTRAVRDISFSPTDAKFATCSDDSGLKVFDFDRVRWRHRRDDNSIGLIRRGRLAPVSWRSRRQSRASGCLTATT